jgi:hypothetical protein
MREGISGEALVESSEVNSEATSEDLTEVVQADPPLARPVKARALSKLNLIMIKNEVV